MGQVIKLEENETVAEILNTEVTPAQVQRARQFIETCHYTTGALFAVEVALREMYGEEPCALADLLATIIRPAAAIEATEI